jgi:hypothetical protein
MYIPSNAFVSKSKIDVYSFSNIKFSIKKKKHIFLIFILILNFLKKSIHISILIIFIIWCWIS